MMVSAEALPERLMRLIIRAQKMPKTIRLTVMLETPSSMPMPAPARALWPRASEKNAMRWLTAIVPSRASSGVRRSMASRAFFIKV